MPLKDLFNFRKNNYRTIVYLGPDRLIYNEDLGIRWLKRLDKSPFQIVALIMSEKDPLYEHPLAKKFNQLPLPEALHGGMRKIKRLLSEDMKAAASVNAFNQSLKQLEPRIGLTIWGYWLPDELSSLPVNGFLNYHPAPLPELRGMEPDTFTILEGKEIVWGTVHKVSRQFDAGAIVKQSEKIKVLAYDTPSRVLNEYYIKGIDAIMEAGLELAKGRSAFLNQADMNQSATLASLKRAYQCSFIHPEKTSCLEVDRLFRAFCGQDIGIRPKICIGGKYFLVRNCMVFSCHHSEKLGQKLNQKPFEEPWKSFDVFALKDGVLMVDIAEPIEVKAEDSLPALPEAPALKFIEAKKPEIDLNLDRLSEFLSIDLKHPEKH